VAIGYGAGGVSQGLIATALGTGAGNTSQGANAVAIGGGAGYTNQGVNSVAIGFGAGATGQAAGSIVLNGTGAELNHASPGRVTVKPVRGDSTANLVGAGFKAVYYNPATGEFAYASS
jgi:hypothetical protein